MNINKKVLMLATTAAMIEQFNKNNIELLNQLGYTVDVIGNFDYGNPVSSEQLEKFKDWILQRGGNYYNYPATRNPFDFKKNVAAITYAIKIVKERKYSFIHCHNPIGAVIGRIVAHKTNTKIIYTAHGLHFYKGAPIKNWLLYYPIEKFLSRWTDSMILINSEDYELVRKKFYCKHVYYVPGIGIEISKFNNKLSKKQIREDYGISSDAFIILSVGELNKNKNHAAVIRALGMLAEEQKNNVYYLIAGQGDLKEYLQKLIDEEGLNSIVKLLGFREDIDKIYAMADVYILPSLREGLNVSIMEAMASGLPCICGKIRGNIDLIDDEKGGYCIENARNSQLIYDALRRLREDSNLCLKFGNYNRIAVNKFSIDKVQHIMKRIYEEL